LIEMARQAGVAAHAGWIDASMELALERKT